MDREDREEERQREPATALDALHYEMLGTLIDLNKGVALVKVELAESKAQADAISHELSAAFDKLQQNTVAVVGYINAKKVEIFADIELSQKKVTDQNKESLSRYDRLLWVSVALGSASLLTNIVTLLAMILSRN